MSSLVPLAKYTVPAVTWTKVGPLTPLATGKGAPPSPSDSSITALAPYALQ
jgi:hypothetical protein